MLGWLTMRSTSKLMHEILFHFISSYYNYLCFYQSICYLVHVFPSAIPSVRYYFFVVSPPRRTRRACLHACMLSRTSSSSPTHLPIRPSIHYIITESNPTQSMYIFTFIPTTKPTNQLTNLSPNKTACPTAPQAHSTQGPRTAASATAA